MSHEPERIDPEATEQPAFPISPANLGALRSFQTALESGSQPLITKFLPEAEGDRPSFFQQLLKRELEFRHRRSEPFSQDEYLKKYPEYATQINEIFYKTLTFGNSAASTGGRPSEPMHRQFKVGETIDDFYLLRWLGAGAFATVFLARQESMQRLVALKLTEYGTDEPRMLAQLDHQNIVRVFDQRQFAHHSQTLYAIYMEYVPAGTLHEIIGEVRRRRDQPELSATLLYDVIDERLRQREEVSDQGSWRRQQLSRKSWPELVCELGVELASALDYAHQRSTLHRDLKPANILLTADGTPKLVDFNIAYSALIEGARPEDHFGGSLAYMSPEQLHAASSSHSMKVQDLDRRTDIFSLGVVLWELLSGERPFEDRTAHSHWTVVADEMAELRSAGVPAERWEQLEQMALPKGLTDVLDRCLRPNREDRFESAEDLACELNLCLHPVARDLIEPPPHSLAALVRTFPILMLTIFCLLPNLLLSFFNVIYDGNFVVKPEAQQTYYQMLIPLKGVLYGLGIAAGIYWTLPLFRAASDVQGGTEDVMRRARRVSFYFGDTVFGISLAAWAISGLLIPAWLTFRGVELTSQEFAHFVLAHLLCGLIAGTLSAFPSMFFMSRVFYPLLLRRTAIPPAEQRDIASLQKRLDLYVRMAIAVPFAASVLLGVLETNTKYAYWSLMIVAVIALAVEYYLSHKTVENFQSLLDAFGRGPTTSEFREPRPSSRRIA